LERIARANAVADMLEIRLDMMETFDLREMIQSASKPALVTYRSIREGGKGTADHKTHASYLLAALEEGAEFVDVERRLPEKWREKIFRARGKSSIVVSTHVPESTPPKETLEEIFEELAATGADIIKTVTHAESMMDNLRVLDLIPKAQERGIKIIAFCMGRFGRISRIFSHLMGGYLTFASLEEGEESAAGQIPVEEMKRILDMLTS
ncbi:MAG: type I 3-dehydroquinate dehydratase, partial [Desulfobacterales bacterium]|nr:type I 3-dehydroquinate dehydratase [Desulfobacterales bacterium]